MFCFGLYLLFVSKLFVKWKAVAGAESGVSSVPFVIFSLLICHIFGSILGIFFFFFVTKREQFTNCFSSKTIRLANHLKVTRIFFSSHTRGIITEILICDFVWLVDFHPPIHISVIY